MGKSHKLSLTVPEEDYKFMKENYLNASWMLQAKIAEERGRRIKSSDMVEEIPENNVVANVWKNFLEKNPALVEEMKRKGTA